jgi:protoheme IX farnesyltransferase
MQSSLVRGRSRDYLELTKPEVTGLVLVSTFAGFYIGSPGPLDWGLLLRALVGTALVASGTAALNMYLERARDARMRRTAERPLPAGRLQPRHALVFGLGLALSGTVFLYGWVNPLASLLGGMALMSYLVCYTPLKSRTPLCTLVGAFPGAVPPLIGWAAARGGLHLEAWILYAILFFWQFPHFLAIGWMYRDDYARAGMRMLSTVDPAGAQTFRQIIWFSTALLLVSLLPALVGAAGILYFAGAALLGVAFLACALWAAATRSPGRARSLLHASVAYLPLLFIFLLVDKQIS